MHNNRSTSSGNMLLVITIKPEKLVSYGVRIFLILRKKALIFCLVRWWIYVQIMECVIH